MPIALDYTSRIDPAALKAANVTVVCRYLSWLHYWGGQTHDYVNPKVIQQPEYDELRAAGIDLVLNWEYDSRDWLRGSAAGQAHAAEAVRQAFSLGYPAGAPIIGSADQDMTRSQWESAGHGYATAFEAGIRSGGYTPGVYGPWDVLTWCRDETGIEVFWQAGMSTSWSQGRNAQAWPGAQLRQRGTKTVAGQVADWSEILGEVNVAAGDADKAFSAPYTGTEPFIRGDSWMAQAVEKPLRDTNNALERIEQDIQAISVGEIDLDALADLVAARIANAIAKALAPLEQPPAGA